MDNAPTIARPAGKIDWRILAGLNLWLGVTLLLLDCTDYSWTNSLADALFGPVVALVAFASLCAASCFDGRRERWMTRLACLASLLEGGVQLAVMALMFAPPFTLGGLFWISEICQEHIIQQTVSPDGRRVAEVRFRPVGSYTGGNGRIAVRVRHRLLPGLGREVYWLPRSYASGQPEEYLLWLDNDTLYIAETGAEVKVGATQFCYPWIVTGPRILIDLLHYIQAYGGEQGRAVGRESTQVLPRPHPGRRL